MRRSLLAIFLFGVFGVIFLFWNNADIEAPVRPNPKANDLELAKGTSGHDPKTASPSVSARDRASAARSDNSIESPGEPIFVDFTEQLGISFQYFNDGDSGRYFNGETNGGGVAWVDFDLDDFPDLYFTNGRPLARNHSGPTPTNRLFRNLSGNRFEDVTAAARVGDDGFGHGVAIGDIDNDGWPDLLILNFGPNVLYRNNGDGTFSDGTDQFGVGGDEWNSSAAFGDLTQDGSLDLYVTCYGTADLDALPVCNGPGYRVYCSPEDYAPGRDVCYLNSGDGRFRPAPADAGFGTMDGRGMGVLIADLDDDGRPDVFVANDKTPSYLFHNRGENPGGSPLLVEGIGVEAGVAFDGQGNLMAGMGIACGDADGDGRLDLFVTHYHREQDTFYKNHGSMAFSDDTARVGLGSATLPFLGFGTEFLDYDNDGWLDLIVANGHVLGSLHWLEAMEANLYRNRGDGRFEDVSSVAGPHFQRKFVGRGLAVADFNRDGGVDVAGTNNDKPAYVLKNATADCGGYLALELVGRISTRDGANARVIVERDGRLPLARELTGGGSYQSTSERRLHFGLGTGVETVDVEIRWTSGIVDRWEAIPVNQSILAIEGREFVGGFGCVESAIGDRQLLEASHPVTNDRRLGNLMRD